jgi:hypothetical protein
MIGNPSYLAIVTMAGQRRAELLAEAERHRRASACLSRNGSQGRFVWTSVAAAVGLLAALARGIGGL